MGVVGVLGVDLGFLNDWVRDKRLDGLVLGVGMSVTVSKILNLSSVGDIKFTSGDVIDVY